MSLNILNHILVVDDQPNWRLAFKILLESEGLKVSEASGFKEAKEMLTKSAFDLVILDVRLVDDETFNVQGLELLYSIKAKTPATKVIIVTGYPESVGEKSEADALIFKVPEGSTFDSRGFKNLIKELVDKSFKS